MVPSWPGAQAEGHTEGRQDVLSWQAGPCLRAALHTFCAFTILTLRESSSLCANQLSLCVMFHMIYQRGRAFVS